MSDDPLGLTTSPWTEAVDRFGSKTPIGSAMRSDDWESMPLALKERAFWTAGLTDARIVSAMRDKAVQGLDQSRPGGTGMDHSRFVADMRNLLGAAPGDSGSLTDITSVRRLELIWNFQMQDAHGYASRKADMDPNLLDAYPAYRLIRVESRRIPRDWYERWGEAGAQVGWEGASKTDLVALKTSPIWIALSRFGRPWPPFDYNSGMGLEDVDRSEAEALDLLDKNQNPAERLQQLSDAAADQAQDWNDGLQASVKGLSDDARGWLKDAFGDQISIDGDTVEWKSQAADLPTAADAATPTPEAVTLPDVDRLAESVAKADSTEQAHAIVALPASERGSLRLNPTTAAMPQVTKAQAFISSVLQKDVAPDASCKVKLIVGQGKYDPDLAIAYVRQGAIPCTVHELAHHIECSDPEILQASKNFIRSRIKAGEVPQSLNKLTGTDRYRDKDFAYEDKWAELGGVPYSGRVYADSLDEAHATEVLTMGLQRLYEDPVGFAKKDPDYFKFILSVLRP